MRVVVTGATGNVGTAVVEHLLAARDDLEVVGLARRVPTAAPGAARHRDRLTWTALDLSDDGCRPTLRAALRGADAVVHLAWGFQPSHDPDYLEELGVGGTRRVLEAATAEQVAHLVHMSSVGAYSPKVDDTPVDEGYPTGGIATSMYSRHKASAERLLDAHEAAVASGGGGPRVARLRPGIVGQRAAGSALLRYGLPGLVPGRAVTLLPLLPLERRLLVPMVHAADVADAVARVLAHGATGAFNLAAADPLTPGDIASALGARHVHAPGRLLRQTVSATWQAHLQPLDPGWIDLALQVPLLDTRRARDELGWTPTRTAGATLVETVAGMRDSASGPTAVLRPRSVARSVRERISRGPVARRRRP